MTLIEELEAVRELLSSPERWVKGYNAVDAKGRSVRPLEEEACRWCLEGALCKVSLEYFSQGYYLLSNVLEGRSIFRFNDDDWTGHAEILAFLDRTIKYVQKEKGDKS